MQSNPQLERAGMRHLELLDALQKSAVQYFLDHTQVSNGLVADSTWKGSLASIAAVGFGLSALLVAVERGWLSRSEGSERTLVPLRFFHDSPQGAHAQATGYQGFYYHFLDMQTGQRANGAELSTIDSSILLAGMLLSGCYFDQDTPAEREIRQLAQALYARANWNWAQDGQVTVRHGWKPESGFLEYRWQGFDESILLYLLGLGSPRYPLPKESYAAFTASYRWERHYGIELLHAAPLFIHHFPHVWVDFRRIQDDFMRQHGLDYFENSRRATLMHQQHAIQNPYQHSGYGEHAWGITASEGPAGREMSAEQNGKRFYGYLARGIPGPDDGTLSPWTAITSLPFAPDIALPAVLHYHEQYPRLHGQYGLKCSLNPSFKTGAENGSGWFSDHYYGINEGPVALMIENYRSGLIWRLMHGCQPLAQGLRRAGFQGGWLEKES